MKSFRGSKHGGWPTSFSYPSPCKRGKGKEKERAGAINSPGGALMGSIGHWSTHSFINLSAVETCNKSALSYMLINDCEFLYIQVF